MLEKMKENEETIELSGSLATGMNHGICLQDERGFLFIETKKKGE